MRLLLMRHAMSTASQELPDLQRPLAPRGEEDAPRMGRFIVQQGWVPQKLVASPAQRAQRTAHLVASVWKGDVVTDEALYGGGVEAILRAAHQDAETVMVVAHNPDMEAAVHWLAPDAPQEAGGGVMVPGAVAAFELPRGIKRGAGRLQWLQHPDTL